MNLLILFALVGGGALICARMPGNRWRLGAWLGLAVAVPLLLIKTQLEKPEPAAQQAQAAATARRQPGPNEAEMRIAIDRRLSASASGRWSRVEVEEASGGNFRLVIWYDTTPSGHRQVAEDTGTVAREALEVLQSFGRQPADEMIGLSVWAQKPEDGVTGKSMVRVYGRTHYDFNTDSLKYKAKY